MWFLVSSIAALAIAPVLYVLAGRRLGTMAFLDGFIMVSVSALVLTHILPEAVHSTGWLALCLAVLGFLGPTWIEHALRRAAKQAHTVTMVFALVGLAVHGLIDGAVLAEESNATRATAFAVALHRLPVGITIWWLLKPTGGRVVASLVLAAIAAATVGGYWAAAPMAELLHESWTGIVQAFVGGALLHVVMHRPGLLTGPTQSGGWRRADGVGAICGIVFSLYVADSYHSHGTVGSTFMHLATESAPALVFAFLLAGVVQALLPSAPLRWMRTGRPASESVRGMVFGLPLPICSCGVVPLYESLVARAVPATAAMAFLVATPELGIDAILISLPLLGTELTVLRIACAAVVALLIGWWVGQAASSEGEFEIADPDEPKLSRATRLRQGLRYGLVEIVDHVGPWIILGLAVAALVEPVLSAEWLRSLPWGADVFVFALLGMPTYVCASGATPLAAILIANGVSPGAAIAFLLSGPGTNITTFGVLSRLHGKRIATLFGVALLAAGIGLGLGINVLFDSGFVSPVPTLHAEEASWFQNACLLTLGGIFVLSVLRQGSRGFVGQVLSPYADDDACHDHDH